MADSGGIVTADLTPHMTSAMTLPVISIHDLDGQMLRNNLGGINGLTVALSSECSAGCPSQVGPPSSPRQSCDRSVANLQHLLELEQRRIQWIQTVQLTCAIN